VRSPQSCTTPGHRRQIRAPPRSADHRNRARVVGLAAREKLLRLADAHRLTDVRVDGLGGLVVTPPADDAGYRAVRAFAAAAADTVGAWVNIVAVDAPGAPTDRAPL
jgi:hypothetical protein